MTKTFTNITIFRMPENYAYIIGNPNILTKIRMTYPSAVQHFCTSERVICIDNFNSSLLEQSLERGFSRKVKIVYGKHTPRSMDSIHARRIN